MAIDIPDLMRAIRDRIDAHKETLGLQGVSYPALNTVPASPWAMVRQSVAFPTEYTKARANQQVVRASIDVVLLVRSDIKRPADAARLDGLIAPILDLFDANAVGGNVNTVLTGLDTSVDHVWTVAQVRRMPIPWGEAAYCHAAIITFDSEFKRKPEAIA